MLQSLPQQVAEHIAALVINGSFAPGSRLRETELAEFFDVSRSTVLEALRMLEQRGLVRIQLQRGAHVTQLSVKELDDLFEVRASLLATGSRLGAERCTVNMARTLRGMLDRLRRALDDVDTYSRTSTELVRTMAQISGNEVIATSLDDFAMRIGRYMRMGLATSMRRRRSVANWGRLIGAVIQRAGSAAALHHAQLAMENRSATLEHFRRSVALKEHVRVATTPSSCEPRPG